MSGALPHTWRDTISAVFLFFGTLWFLFFQKKKSFGQGKGLSEERGERGRDKRGEKTRGCPVSWPHNRKCGARAVLCGIPAVNRLNNFLMLVKTLVSRLVSSFARLASVKDVNPFFFVKWKLIMKQKFWPRCSKSLFANSWSPSQQVCEWSQTVGRFTT